MQYRKLGKSNIKVSQICMGCMGFGDAQTGPHSWTINEEKSREIIRKGIDLGVNFFDTAIVYQAGTSEMYLGRALNDYVDREDVVVATKFIPRSQEEIENGISGQEHVKNSLNLSLKHLEMDYVDLYIYHMWDWNTPIDDYLEGLNDLVEEGKVKAIGIANCFAWQLAEANMKARANGWSEFTSVQNHYNLIMREEEREMSLYTRLNDIATTPYSALASGRLSRRPNETSKRLVEDEIAKFKYDATAKQDQIIIDRVAEIADRHEVSMTEVSLSWLMSKVTSPIAGATKLHHIEGAARAADVKLSSDDMKYLEEPYVAHSLSGVMVNNLPDDDSEKV